MSEDFFRPELGKTQIPKVVSQKWGHELCTEGYVPGSKRVLRSATLLFDPNTALIDFIVTLSIADVITPKNTAVSYEYLSYIAGLEETVVKESMKRLAGLNYVSISPINEKRFIPKFTGLIDKVLELNEKWDSEYQDKTFPDREKESSV